MINKIIKGHLLELLNKEKDLYKNRISICKECKLFSNTIIGEICDHTKCLYKDKVYDVGSKPYKSICGCGCRLNAKLRLKDEKCVLGKW